MTLDLLKYLTERLETKKSPVPPIWIQPGAENDKVKKFVSDNGLSDKVILGGPCILVEGDGIIQSSL